MGKKKGNPVEDELMRQCKFWQVTMRPAPPKEKADAAAQRHSRIRGDLAEAEKAYNETQQAAVQAVRDWFFHTSPAERELILQMQPPPTKLERVASDAVDVSQTVVVTLTSEED